MKGYEYILGNGIVLGRAIKSPLRDDRHPSFNIFQTKSGGLYWKDFAYGEGDLYKLTQEVYRCDFKRAVEILASVYGISHFDIPEPIGRSIINSIRKAVSPYKEDTRTLVTFKPAEANMENRAYQLAKKEADKYHLHLEELEEFDMIPIEEASVRRADGHTSHFMYGGNAMFAFKVGEDSTKIYMPGRKPKYIGNTRKEDIYGLSKMVYNPTLHTVIVGGHKDVAMMSALFGKDNILQFCCFNSESIMPDEDQMVAINQRSDIVFLLYDNDAAGHYNAAKITEKYPIIRKIDQSKMMEEGEDISDVLRREGRVGTMAKLVVAARETYNHG